MMPDWNPAEIIGLSPKPLARSLYQFLITSSIWNEARASMGYKSLINKELMYIIGNTPYIDVRKSFNSLSSVPQPHNFKARCLASPKNGLNVFLKNSRQRSQGLEKNKTVRLQHS